MTNADKDKALDWLGALRTNHGTELNTQELDSAAKIIEDFENPKLSEEKSSDKPRFRIANDNQEIFVSNAEQAVKGIKQEKATPQQWKAMVQSKGGLKAGEDKWLGLSEWLDEQATAKRSLTKQEVLDFIGENKIRIEEVEYGEENEAYNEADDELSLFYSDMEEKYGSEYLYEMSSDELKEERLIEARGEYNYSIRDINFTRLGYTAKGLENKREIALTVPTIESRNESDDIHFGDAGDGRAVAWARFGETTDSEGNSVLVIDEIQSKRHQEGREQGYANVDRTNIKELEDELSDLYEKSSELNTSLNDKYGSYKWLRTETWTENGMQQQRMVPNEDVLSPEEYNDVISLRQQIKEKDEEIGRAEFASTDGIPDAPFDKNWHELAMKRMLRLAAEEGFDKVAWTKGEQQAERYNLSAVVDHISYFENEDGTLDARAYFPEGGYEPIGKTLEEVERNVGKDIAKKMQEGVSESTENLTWGMGRDGNNIVKEYKIISGGSLKVGGKGMEGFYDKMLPSFMNKYGKKWGVKVGEVELPEVEEAGRKMWSIDVTPEMKDSVMEGQVMFRFIGEQGAANLDKAEEATARLDNLNVAREMEESGKDAKSIKMATGWERGADKKWRYEVDDDIKIDLSANVDFRRRHPEYARYEELKNKELAAVLELGEPMTEEEHKEYDFAKTIFGGDTELHRSRKLKDYVESESLFKNYPELAAYSLNIVDEMEDGASGSFNPDTKAVTLKMSFKVGEMERVLVHELQHAIQHIEGFAQGGDMGLSGKMIAEVKDIIGAPKNLPFNYLISYIDNGMETREQHQQLLAMAEENGYSNIVDYVESLSPYQYYHRLAGEVEARNVQERMGMTAEKRRQSLAAETEDVAREDQIFIFDGLESAAMPQRTMFRMTDTKSQYNEKVDGLNKGIEEKGLRGHLGEVPYKKMMRTVYEGNDEIAQNASAMLQDKEWNLYDSIETYLADEAQTMGNEEMWQDVRQSLADAVDFFPSIKDTKYAMWLNKNRDNDPSDPNDGIKRKLVSIGYLYDKKY